MPSIRLEHEDSVTITKPQEDSVQIPSTKNRFTGFTCHTGRRGMRKHASSKNTLLHWATRNENIHDFQEHLEDVAYTLDPEAKSGSASGTGTRQLGSLYPFFELRGCSSVSSVNWSVNYFVSVDQTTQRPRVACCSLLTQGPWMLLSRGAKPRLCQYILARDWC